MDQKIQINAEKQLKNQHRKKIWKRIVSVLGCVVVFCTTYALILPAITLSDNTYCGIEEHKHDESCYKTELICELSTEAYVEEGHVHGEECYQLDTELICLLEENEEHVHEESCWTEASVLICELPEKEAEAQEEVHTHIEGCYIKALSCTSEEHTHKLSCYSNPNADLETAMEWEATLPKELTGNWREDVLAIAESQLGYRESEENYIVAEDEEKKGYTRYGDWYGDNYGDWCAMFVSFCMNYAEVEGIPLDANCQNWIKTLKQEKYNLYRDASSYVPEAGDIIFFDWNKDGVSEHVGLVAEVTLNANGTVSAIKTIEGNSNNRVEYGTFKGNDSKIIGYGEMLQAGLKESSNELKYEDETMTITAAFPEEFELPEGAVLSVEKVDAETDEETYSEMEESVRETVVDENHRIGSLDLFKFKVLVNGEEYEVSSEVEVSVSVDYAQPRFSEEELTYVDEFKVVTLEKEEPEMQTYALRRTTTTEEEGTAYSVTENDAVVENAEDGVLGFNFNMYGLPTVGFTVTNTTQSGNFWKRVNTFDEIKENDTLLIVSIEANVALKYANSGYGTPVVLEEVTGKANKDFYEVKVNLVGDNVTNVTEAEILPDETKFVVKSINYTKGTFRLESLSSTNKYLSLGSKDMFSGTATDLDVTSRVETTTNVENKKMYSWWIDKSDYYLSNASGNTLKASNSVKDDDKGMFIFRLQYAELTIPGNTINEYTPPQIPTRPDYHNEEVSGEKTGNATNITGLSEVSVEYASDPATSNVQDKFLENATEAGRLLTDKSVIYGDDDYNAYETYAEGEFGVTLSAVGQVPTEYRGKTPAMDVVVILDTSYSMLNINYKTTDGRLRMEWAVDAVNDVIYQIMQEPTNRVGLVTFSDAPQTVLPLDRYTTQKNTAGKYEYLKLTTDSKSYNHARGTTLKNLQVSSNVRNQAQQSISFTLDYGNDRPNWEGTFTQSGIQQAAEILLNNPDTTSNDMARLPVIIMISDGGPTLCSSSYKTPNDGPVYGNSGNPRGDKNYMDCETSGLASEGNHYGINGYYTVLTAKYFKDLVGSHYDMKAKYVSVGIGISDAEDNSAVHDGAYCRAVLDPSKERLQEAVTSNGAESFEAAQMKSLLENNFTSKYVAIPNHYEGFNALKVTHSLVPVLKHDYEDVDYADMYMTGTADNLAENLINYLNEIQRNSYKWNYVLENRTSVTIEDPIGHGMEVKSEPVLRFGHDNYSPVDSETVDNVTTYYYKADETKYPNGIPYAVAYPLNANADSRDVKNIYFDISRIGVTVTDTVVTNEDGKQETLQTVKLVVPDDLLPLLYLEYYGAFYYEEHPIRLIYQVGLTQDAIDEVNALGPGESVNYYTNQWEETTATAKFKYNHENEFDFDKGDEFKENNVTDTLPTNFSSDSDETTREVVQSLGNNGRLTLTKESETVNVRKKWNGEPMDSITVYLLADGEPYGDPVTLTADDNWEYSWTGLPKYDSVGGLIKYTVSEEHVLGYETKIEEVKFYETEGWVTATGLEDKGEYVLISTKADTQGSALINKAISSSKYGFDWTEGVADILEEEGNPENNAIWIAEKSGNNIYLKNKATGKYMNIGWNWSGMSIQTYIQTTSDKGGVVFANGHLQVAGSSDEYYFTGINSSSNGSTNTSSGSAYTFALYEYGTVTKEAPKGGWEITNTKIEEIPLEITIKKTNGSGQALEGAVFDLYQETSNVTGEMKIPGTDATGILYAKDLTVGKDGSVKANIPTESANYYLVETKAPDGFELLEAPVKFVVVEGSNKVYIAEAQDEDNEMAEVDADVITVINKAGYELPQTGGVGTTKFILGGALLMLTAILIFIKRILGERYI